MTPHVSSSLPGPKALEPRPYQLDLVDYVCERNGIIYLPTGAGKTFVAILALKRHSHQLEKTIEEGGKRAIFMCNTVELARQQAIEIKKNTNLRTGFYVGERNVDYWTRTRWLEEINENQVLVGTVQVFVNILTANYLKITDLSVVIIDECHHATKTHPMHEFMHLFKFADQTKLPRVIGLTGVLLKGKKLTNIREDLQNLEATFRGNIVTVGSMAEYQNVMVYSTNPVEQIVCYGVDIHQFALVVRIKAVVQQLAAVVDQFELGHLPVQLTKGLAQVREPNKKKYIKNLMSDFVFQMDNYGLYAAGLAIMSPIIEFEIKKRQAETLALRQLYRLAITKCELIRHLIVKKLKDLIDDDESDDDVRGGGADCAAEGDTTPRSLDAAVHTLDVILNFSSPKTRSLLLYLKSQFAGKQASDIKCLLFVERRYTAKCLYYVVQKFIQLTPELRDVLRPQYMVGRNSIAPGIETLLDAKWNKKAIDSFREHDCNMIICSNVLEEGIDVQACNHVITIDPLKTFSSYIQTKGRARSANAIYTIFAPTIDQQKVVTQVAYYKEMHKIIRQFLIGRVLDRDDPTEDATADQFADSIPPFMSRSGACLLATSAMAILNRYCQTLPADMFGLMAPWYRKVAPTPAQSLALAGRMIVELKLPMQSTVRQQILSDPHGTPKLCKMSAALKACKLLYEQGELNERLLPVTKQECVGKLADVLFQHWRKFDDDVTTKEAGKRQLRQYDRMCPEELYDAMPRPGEPCWAYTIDFATQFERNDYNAHVADLLRPATATFAILLRHRQLPHLAEMPLFMNQGRLAVTIGTEAPLECSIATAQELQQLRKFHLMLFRDLLQLWKSFFVLDKGDKENAYLLVPLNAARNAVDWELVRRFQRLEPGRSRNLMERQQMVHRPEDYRGMVINKWYSGLEDERYVVTAVRTDLTTQSAFDGADFKTYADFTLKRFGSQIGRIVQPQQFMLEVRALTSRRNFFINAVGKNSARDKKHSVILLIPELCHNFRFPAELWMKALFLPCILHRLHFMLHAETLRRRINRFLSIPEAATYRPQRLLVDTSLKRVTDTDGNAIEDEAEPKRRLCSMPTKPNKHSVLINAMLAEDPTPPTWKAHLQPIDHDRQLDTLYPIEVDYYYQFITGLVDGMESLKLQQEEEWTWSQLEMPQRAVEAGGRGAVGGSGAASPQRTVDANLTRLSLKDVPLTEKRRIRILEHSTEGTTTPITTAEQYEFLAAITTSRANDVFDMERLEILGDSFLKFSVSLYLANKFPQLHEGFLTELKGRLVSNRNLLYCLLDRNGDVPARICASLFNPQTEWMPPLASLPLNIRRALDTDLAAPRGGRQPIIPPGELYGLELTDAEVLEGNCSAKSLEQFVSACRAMMDLAASGVEGASATPNDTKVFLHKEVMADKILADTTEALLGVCLKNYGIHRTFRMLEFFGICRPEKDDKPLANLLDLSLGGAKLRTNIASCDIDGFLINYHKLEENLGYRFRDRAYLLQALTHPSFPTNRVTGCYQELEFIGDAILDFLVSCYIFERYEHMTPGMVTDLRSALVNNITLGCVCVRHRFHLFLHAENAMLAESVKRFAEFQDSQGHRVTQQVRILMEEDRHTTSLAAAVSAAAAAANADADAGGAASVADKAKFNMAVNVDVPKVLGDIVEALIAAVYMDSRDLLTTWHVVYRLLAQELDEFSLHVPLDPVRELYEHKHAQPRFSEAIADGEVVLIKCQFTCVDRTFEANGFGNNAKQAKKCAAKHALRILAKHAD